MQLSRIVLIYILITRANLKLQNIMKCTKFDEYNNQSCCGWLNLIFTTHFYVHDIFDQVSCWKAKLFQAKIVSDGSNTILLNIERTQTSIFGHRMDMFIILKSNFERPSNEHQTNIENISANSNSDIFSLFIFKTFQTVRWC